MVFNGETHLNRRNTNFNGQEMVIIEYLNSRDMTVQFEDGGIAQHVKISDFETGTVANPKRNYESKAIVKHRKERVGKIILATNGQRMIIKKYYSASNITIQFEGENGMFTGPISYGETYTNFKKGRIFNPYKKENIAFNQKIVDLIPLKYINKQGYTKDKQRLKIININTLKDIDLITEKGLILKNRTYTAFKRGTIRIKDSDYLDKEKYMQDLLNKIETREKYLGLEKHLDNGDIHVITEIKNINDIKVLNLKGRCAKHQTVENFKKGLANSAFKSNKNNQSQKEKLKLLAKKRIGEKVILKNGVETKIINYRSSVDIDVQFNDTKNIKYHATYSDFKRKNIKDPSRKRTSSKNKRYEREGGIGIANNGQKMKITRYGNAYDIDVIFEDGIESFHKTYLLFQKGNIANPKDKHLPFDTGNTRLWETNINKDNLLMQIVNYESASQITVRFKDGTEVETTYNQFKLGYVNSPNKSSNKKRNIDYFLNKKNIMLDGQICKIIKYHNTKDITVKFENGYITDTTVDIWLLGKVKNLKSYYPILDQDFDLCQNLINKDVEDDILER